MKNIKIIITLVFTILIGLSLASCKSNDDVKAEIVDVVGLRTTASVTVKIADDKMLVTQGTFCASIYKEDNSLVGTVTFTETNYNNQTKDFADLEKDTTYIVKLYATYNGKKHTMDKATVKTISKGTQDDPTLINTVEDFNNIKKDPAGHFKLNADLDFNQAVISTLFTDTTPFKGTINGNNKTIKNFKLETPSTHNGIFGYLATNSTIQDLIIDNVTMTITRSTDAYIGILAGTNKGTVKNVTLKNSQVNINSNGSGTLTIGTLIGTNSDSGKIEDSIV